MKQNTFIKLLLVAAIGFSSCKKAIDLSPTDTFNEQNAFQNLDDIQQGTNGAHGRLSTYINTIYSNALVSDEAKLGNGNSGQGALTYRYQFGADATSGGDLTAAFYGYYALIDQVNRVLKYIPLVTVLPAEQARLNILKGQLLALRAIGHFGLLQSYSNNYNPTDPLGVPIMLVSDILAKPARNTMGEVMNQIEADLIDAKTILASEPFSDTVMNKINIAAFQARVSLYKRDYDAAITFATEVINSGVKPLASRTVFPGIWTDDNTEEILFRIRFTGAGLGAIWTTTGGNIYIAPSDKLVASYTPTDIRLSSYIGGVAGSRYVNKYYSSNRGGRVVDMKVIRIAEMYLIRAEAYAKRTTPDVNLGAADLNTLRAVRISGYVNQGFITAADLITAVLEERFKELAFEGHRFFDLKRNNLPVQRLGSDAATAWQTLDAGDYKFVFPIPSAEMTANPNMVQNPGY